MVILKRTGADDKNFEQLAKLLDEELKIRDGEEHAFYAQLNKTNTLTHVIVAYDGEEAVGCGAIRVYSEDTMEVKRMYVMAGKRGRGVASVILAALESWCKELNYTKCILETGKNQPEAIRLYEKNNYTRIAPYGRYKVAANSVCFEKIF